MLITLGLKLFAVHLLKLFPSRHSSLPTETARNWGLLRSNSRALFFEQLEDRTLLSTLIVNTTADNTTANDGMVTLREAIIAANTNSPTDLGQTGVAGLDEIVFAGAAANGTILLDGATLGDLDVTEDLTIDGNGAANTVIDAQQNSRIFDVSAAGTDLTVNNLTLQNGRTSADGEQGGAIRSLATAASQVTINNSTLSGNSTTGSFARGGAIYVYEDGNDIVIANSLVTGNFTTGSYSHGGAVTTFGGGDVTITDSTFSGNYTDNSASDAGAIYAHRGTVTVISSSLTGNSSARTGGGIFVGASGDVVITGSTLSGNNATGDGGAVYVGSGDVTIVNSTLSGNTTTTGAGGGIASPDRFNITAITIVNSTLSGNRVLGTPTHGGGAIYFDYGDLTIVNSTLTNNSANVGGAIGINPDNSEYLTIHNSIVAGNTAATNTDFTAPGGAPGTLDARSSLIGRSDGTTLAATALPTASGAGNHIGGVTAGAGINPMLGPLQDNGGPTFTHALLGGSLAVDAGSNTLAADPTFGGAPLTSDQRLAPFHRIFGTNVDMGSFEAQPLLIQGNTAFLTGADGDDRIIYRVPNSLLRINGVPYKLPSNIDLVRIDGGNGRDTLNAIGTAADDSALTRPEQVFVDYDPAHSGFDLTGVDLETVILDSNGGNDTLTLRDSAGDDKFFARPVAGVLFSADGSYQSNAFGFQMTAIASTGNDLARFSDSPGNDTLNARLNLASISGPGFSHSAQNFDVLVASSLSGVDSANLSGTAGGDFLTARGAYAVMTGAGINFQLDSFESVNADGRGDSDLVRLIGSPGVDTLVATPDSSQYVSRGFTVNTSSFERLTANAGPDAGDLAVLSDSAGDDLFNGTLSTGELTGVGFFTRTTNFDTIRIRGVNGGVNTRTLNNVTFTLVEQGTWV